MRVLTLGIIATGVSLLSSCGKTAAPASSPANPSSIVGAVAAGVGAIGKGMTTGRSAISSRLLTPAVCDAHGYPIVNQSDGLYPGQLTYCFVKIDQGDTVIGGFTLAKSVTCMLNSAGGVTYDGVQRTVPVTTTGCFTSSRDSVPTTMSVKVTGSAPASFNTNFQHGVIMEIVDLGLTFKIATNTTGTTSSFLTSENWTTDGRTGTTEGSIDSVTGNLWYESRVNRLNCTTSSSCGWNRHTRIYANVTMDTSTPPIPTGLKSVSFAYSNIQNTPGQTSLGGLFITAKGDLTTGIKARYWQATHDGTLNNNPTAVADYGTAANWAEVANTKCFTSTSDVAGTCGTGLDKFSTNAKFVMSGNETPVATWFASATAQTFTAVNPDSDLQ